MTRYSKIKGIAFCVLATALTTSGAASAETVTLSCPLDNIYVFDLSAATGVVKHGGATLNLSNVAISDDAISFVLENGSYYRVTTKIDRTNGQIESDTEYLTPFLIAQAGGRYQHGGGTCTKIPNRVF